MVAAFDIGGLRAIVIGVHAELRSRGEAEPRLPEPPEPDVQDALRDAAAAAAEALDELKQGSANHELVERALALLEGPEDPPSLDELAALRTGSKAKPIAAYREAIEAAICAESPRRARAASPTATSPSCWSSSPPASRSPRSAAPGSTSRTCSCSPRACSSGPRSAAAYRARFSHLLVDEFQDTNRLQLRLIEALRGPRSQLIVVGDELQSIYGFRHADLDVFRRRRQAIEASAPAPS